MSNSFEFKTMGKAIKNVIIRNLTEEQRKDIMLAMRETGMCTASKALLAVCRGYAQMVLVCRSNLAEMERLKAENRKLRKGLETIRSIRQQLDQVLEHEE